MSELEARPQALNADAAQDSSPRQFPRAWAAGVCVVTFLAYLSTLRFQFVHDDRGIIVDNPATHSWHAVPGYFLTGVWGGVTPTFLANAYRPIYLLWFRINDAIFGLHPAGWHLTSVLAHVVATYFVIRLAFRITGDWPAALISGLLFGLHPVHIEGVAWISGVDDPLVTALLIPAYLCWLRSRESKRGGGRWLGASLAMYGLAMLIKEIAIILPAILFVSQWLDYPCPLEPQPRGRVQRFIRVIRVVLPHGVMAAAYLVVRMIALKGFWHPAAQISWLTVVLTWPSLLVFYLKLLFWPVGLSPFYGLEYITHPTLRITVLPALVLLLVAVGLWKWATRSRPVALTIPWLIVPVLPILNVQVFGNGNFAHNRYIYLASVGFVILIALALKGLKVGKQYFGAIPSLQIGLVLGLALVFCFAINQEDRYYSSDAAFYSYASSRMGNQDPAIAMDFANTLAEQGDFSRAAEIYQKVIQAQPEMWSAHFNLGYMEYQLGDLDLAVHYLSSAAAGDPANAGAVFYLGLADLKLNRLDAAEANLRRAVVLAPATPNYHFALGMVMKVKGNGSGALAEFRKELEINPGNHAAVQQAGEIQGAARESNPDVPLEMYRRSCTAGFQPAQERCRQDGGVTKETYRRLPAGTGAMPPRWRRYEGDVPPTSSRHRSDAAKMAALRRKRTADFQPAQGRCRQDGGGTKETYRRLPAGTGAMPPRWRRYERDVPPASSRHGSDAAKMAALRRRRTAGFQPAQERCRQDGGGTTGSRQDGGVTLNQQTTVRKVETRPLSAVRYPRSGIMAGDFARGSRGFQNGRRSAPQ